MTPDHTLPENLISRRARRAGDQAVGFLMQQAVENRDCLSLAAGLVDEDSLPVEETRSALSALLSDEERARQVLQYGTTAGADGLRNSLIGHLARLEGCSRDELGIETDQIIMTTGSQQLIACVADVLLDPGDICLVAAPTYFVFLSVLDGVGARSVAVKTDNHGMCPDALHAELHRLDDAGESGRVKLIYVVSYYENPSGVSLAADRRARIVEIARHWSRSHRIHILEDVAYRELRYDGPDLPSVWSFDTSRESVILAQTFSKSFSPGVRVGFGVVPRALIAPICNRKSNEDFGSANLNQHLIDTVLNKGLYEPHVASVRASYRSKRDAMLDAADRYFSDADGVGWIRPDGGLYVWMHVPESISTGFDSELFHRATRVEKVMYVPGELCYPGPIDKRPRNFMRLSFGVQSPDGIDAGMQRLAAAVRSVL